MNTLRLMGGLSLIVSIAIWQCAAGGGGGSKTVTVPADNSSYLICGSLIVENNFYSSSGDIGGFTEGRQVEETYTKGIEAAVLGKHLSENGNEESKVYYIETDENGYFFLENLPPGEYALKGFRISLNDGRYLTVFSDLDGAESAYLMRRREDQMIIAKGDYFPYPAFNRIVNLRHNIFFMSNTYMVGHQTGVVIRDQSFNFNDIKYNRDTIEQYLIDHFPENGWKQYLMASMQENLQIGY